MKLSKDYKLIYADNSGEERVLKASKKNIPTAEDVELDPNLDALEDVNVLFVGKDGLFHAIKKVVNEDGTVTTSEEIIDTVKAGEDELFVPAEPVEVESKEALVASIADGGYTVVKTAISDVEPIFVTGTSIVGLEEGGSIEGAGTILFQVANGGTLIFKGDGEVKSTDGYCVDCGSTSRNTAGSVIIAGGKFTAGGATAVQCEHGTVEITGGEFKSENAQYLINCIDGRDDASIVISGGKFYGFDPANADTHDKGPEKVNYVKAGYKSENKGDYYEVVPADAE